jgi:hypothetical protein
MFFLFMVIAFGVPSVCFCALIAFLRRMDDRHG